MVEFADAVFETEQEAIRIYPNPVRHVLHVAIPGTHYSILILDISGKTVIQQFATANPSSGGQTAQHATLNTHHLAKGLYFVKVELSSGQTVVKKIVIQ